MKRKVQPDLFNRIKNLMLQAKLHVVSNVNSTMVYTYFEIGRMIVEEQQKGKQRAQYGKKLLQDLSKKLTK